MLSRLARRYRTAIEAGCVAAVLVGVKFLVERLDAEFLSMTPLVTSIIAGGIFLFGLILAGTLADYKESEKIPAEFVSSCESIYEEGLSLRAAGKTFELEYLRGVLVELADSFMADTRDPESRRTLATLRKLQRSFLQMEELGVPPNYIVRLKTEESSIRKNVLRVYHIQRTDFLPSAYILVELIVVLILGMLVFIKIEPFYDAVIIIVFLTFLFVYILRLLKRLDRPFRTGEKTMDDVSLFLVKEFRERLSEEI